MVYEVVSYSDENDTHKKKDIEKETEERPLWINTCTSYATVSHFIPFPVENSVV